MLRFRHVLGRALRGAGSRHHLVPRTARLPRSLRSLMFVQQHSGRPELVAEHRKARGEKGPLIFMTI